MQHNIYSLNNTIKQVNFNIFKIFFFFTSTIYEVKWKGETSCIVYQEELLWSTRMGKMKIC